jgi:hypothetical protein
MRPLLCRLCIYLAIAMLGAAARIVEAKRPKAARALCTYLPLLRDLSACL